MTCIHRWLVESPNGSHMLPATCKKCGDTKAFPAYERYEYTGQGPLTLKGSAGHHKPMRFGDVPLTPSGEDHTTQAKDEARAVIQQYEARG